MPLTSVKCLSFMQLCYFTIGWPFSDSYLGLDIFLSVFNIFIGYAPSNIFFQMYILQSDVLHTVLHFKSLRIQIPLCFKWHFKFRRKRKSSFTKYKSIWASNQCLSGTAVFRTADWSKDSCGYREIYNYYSWSNFKGKLVHILVLG